jgi:glycosyltransferase involved in cell wall biosynthesis
MKLMGHDVHLDSTNGYDNFPADMQENVKCRECGDDHHRDPAKCKLDKEYDLSLSYTACFHFNEYTHMGKKKFVVYNIDSDILPKGWAKFHSAVDKVLPSSTYSKNTLLKAGMPEDKLIVVPHCYDSEFIDRKEVFPINTNRKRKYLTVIQQPHKRKGINKLLEGWGKAFTKKDDVVLVAKVRTTQKNKSELFFNDELVAVMTFSHGNMSKGGSPDQKDIWELNRFCTKINTSITGVAGKLLAYFKNSWARS